MTALVVDWQIGSKRVNGRHPSVNRVKGSGRRHGGKSNDVDMVYIISSYPDLSSEGI